MAYTNGNTNGTTPFLLKDAPVENQRPMKVRVIGAGFSGILAAIRSVFRFDLIGTFLSFPFRYCCLMPLLLRIPERLRNIDLVVYEKNEGIGGVW